MNSTSWGKNEDLFSITVVQEEKHPSVNWSHVTPQQKRHGVLFLIWWKQLRETHNNSRSNNTIIYYMANPVLGKSLCSDWLFLGFHGNGPNPVFLFWSEAGKFKICYQNSEKKKVNDVILHMEIIRRSDKSFKFFQNFKGRWRRRTFLSASHRKCISL